MLNKIRRQELVFTSFQFYLMSAIYKQRNGIILLHFRKATLFIEIILLFAG